MKDRVIVGIHAVKECLKVYPKQVTKIWFQEKYERRPELAQIEDSALKMKLKIETKHSQELDKVAKTHQGVVLFCSAAPEWNSESLISFGSQVLLLDGIEDPHNLGAIFRTAWLTDVKGILVPRERATGLTPIVHKSACGGVEHVPLLQVPSFQPTIEKLKQDGYWVFGLSHKARKTISQVSLPEKLVWALGAEDSGLRSTTEKLCDELVSIPQSDSAASFNVSVAAGIVCFEFFKKYKAQSLNKS